MDYKRFLKPTAWKLAVSLILTVALVLLLSSVPYVQTCACIQGGLDACTDYFQYLIFKGTHCHCTCTSATDVASDYLLLAAAPFILFYLLYSAISVAMPKGGNIRKGKR